MVIFVNPGEKSLKFQFEWINAMFNFIPEINFVQHREPYFDSL